ncbi:hypothetical protein J1N35_000891 [Gossypium stocksii]|uniref:Uncharacterized protein n=1 Tax=Gossypium stocksii TaxID=47602 RepID=A0A9D4AL69_9ROSI|nr:hypothetical protein J1N35_000891 [Gossypium stocksii]
MEASDNKVEGGSRRVPTGIGFVTPTSKFKRRMVSAIRDFQPGCGREAASNSGLSR